MERPTAPFPIDQPVPKVRGELSQPSFPALISPVARLLSGRKRRALCLLFRPARPITARSLQPRGFLRSRRKEAAAEEEEEKKKKEGEEAAGGKRALLARLFSAPGVERADPPAVLSSASWCGLVSDDALSQVGGASTSPANT